MSRFGLIAILGAFSFFVKIAIVTDHFLPRIGGAEYASHCLATALADRGHQITVVAPQLKKNEPKTNYSIIRYINNRFFPSVLARSIAVATSGIFHKPDIIHAQLIAPAGIGIFPYSRFMNIPLLVSPQGADIHTFPAMNYGLLLNPKYQFKIESLLKRLDAVTYSSRLMKKLLYVHGFRGNHAYYLPNGTVTGRFHHQRRQQLRRSFGFADDSVVIVAVSRYSPIKGLVQFVQALNRLPSNLPRWQAVIAGSNVQNLAPQIEEAGLTAKVRLIPNLPFEFDDSGIPIIPSPAIADLLIASDIYAAPALSGGFELSSADAIAAGLATVIFDENGSKDFIEDTSAGIVVPTNDIAAFANALSTIIINKQLRSTMHHNALLAAPALDWKAIAQSVELIYQSILTTQGNKA